MEEATGERSQATGHDTITYPYVEAKRLAGEGVWSVMLPDAPNMDPDEVVIACVGPKPSDERYDSCTVDAGGEGEGRWITMIAVGTVDGELDMYTVETPDFLNNYRWTRSEASPIPLPSTIGALVGLVSGARTRDEAPLPTAAARTVINAMVADSMAGHVQTTLPGSTILHWFSNILIMAMGAVALTIFAVIGDPQGYAGVARMVATFTMVLAATGILVDTFYRRELVGMKRIPEGFAEGRAKVSSYLRMSSALTFGTGLLLFLLVTLVTA